MTLLWVIYFIDTLTISNGHGFVIALIITAISCIISGVMYDEIGDNGSERRVLVNKTILVWFKRAICTAVVILVYSSLVPSKDTAYKMLAAYGIESVANNNDVQRLSGKSLELIEKTLDKHLKEVQDAQINREDSL